MAYRWMGVLLAVESEEDWESIPYWGWTCADWLLNKNEISGLELGFYMEDFSKEILKNMENQTLHEDFKDRLAW